MQQVDWKTPKPSYELQLIDCNCNDCIFMKRDMVKFKKWESLNREIQLSDFTKSKDKAIKDAISVKDESGRRGQLRVANKMNFQFDREGQINYGDCEKFNKPVSFLPNICQIETQECFKHRKDA